MTNLGALSRQNQTNIDETQRGVVYASELFKPKYARRTFVGRYKETVASGNKWFRSMITQPKVRRRRKKR